MISKMNIRTAERDNQIDLTQLAHLNALFNGASDTAEQLASRLADPCCVETPILAEISGRIVGFAALRVVPCVFYSEAHAELTELYVEDAYRHQGVGQALVAYAERLAIEKGAQTMVILTDFENRAAQSLYRKMGYNNEDLVLSKDLSKNENNPNSNLPA
jgi:ribosomal protein S18 acetylase RimI-like enzyme